MDIRAGGGLRQRHAGGGGGYDPSSGMHEIETRPLPQKDIEKIHAKKIRRDEKKSMVVFFCFIVLALGIPAFFIHRLTPFYVFPNLGCRMMDRLHWMSPHVKAADLAYQQVFDQPPLVGSPEHQRMMHWGTYDPTRLFALKTTAAKPLSVAIAWYDVDHRYPMRHLTVYLHNRVLTLPSEKRSRNRDAVHVEWAVHDGHHYGRQLITDPALHLSFEIEFLKSPEGDSWLVRLLGKLYSDGVEREDDEGEDGAAIDMMIYMLNEDTTQSVELLPPPKVGMRSVEEEDSDAVSVHRFKPTLHTTTVDFSGKPQRVELRVTDDVRRKGSMESGWRAFAVKTAGHEATTTGAGAQSLRASAPFALHVNDTFGGRVRERVSVEGKTRVGLAADGLTASDVYEGVSLDLRALGEEGRYNKKGTTDRRKHRRYDEEDEDTFQVLNGALTSYVSPPPPLSSAAFNMMVLKRRYTEDFRLEFSLLPLTDAERKSEDEDKKNNNALTSPSFSIRHDTLSACERTNLLRHRQKEITAHHRRTVRSWVKQVEGSAAGLVERMAARVFSELLGSLSYVQGSYTLLPAVTEQGLGERVELTQPAEADDDREEEETDEKDLATTSVRQTPAAAYAFIGSRTDEPFGRADLTGLHTLYLVRYNREMAKQVLLSWLVDSQDPETGFIPARTDFQSYAQSMMPAEWRYETANVASPPSLVVALQELLREIKRKPGRMEHKKKTKGRHSDAYLASEKGSDEEVLMKLLPALRRWRSWWHKTQCGTTTDGAEHGEDCSEHRRPLEDWPKVPSPGRPQDLLGYRWRGRTTDSSGSSRLPSSGMDDYPRPICQGFANRELHVDLFAWIAALSKVISQIEVEFLGLEESVSVDWEAHLMALHWDSENRRLSDRIGCPSATGSSLPPFSPYVGFVNLLPLSLGVVSNPDVIQETLRLERDHLRSDFGLQSLSFESVRRMRGDEESDHGSLLSPLVNDNTYTGPVWPWQNFLYVYGLQSFVLQSSSTTPTLPSDVRAEAVVSYKLTRQSMLDSMLSMTRWWECFNPVTGEGLGSKTYVGSTGMLLAVLYHFQ